MGNTSISKKVLIINSNKFPLFDQGYIQQMRSYFQFRIVSFQQFIKFPNYDGYICILAGKQMQNQLQAWWETFGRRQQHIRCQYVQESSMRQNPTDFFKKLVQHINLEQESIQKRQMNLKKKIEVKFVDSQVQSTQYQIFLNFMKNKNINFEIYNNVLDYIASQKNSQSEFVICSKQFLKSMTDFHQKIICFCSKNQELGTKSLIQKQNSPIFAVENNFSKIIKIITRSLQKGKNYNYPIKSIIIYTVGISTNFLQKINRKKIKVRVIKRNSLDQLLKDLSTQLYCTLIINNDKYIINQVEQRIEKANLRLRVNILKIVGNEDKFLTTLDQYIQKGYEVIPKKLQSLMIIGNSKFFEQIKKISYHFYSHEISLEYKTFEQFQKDSLYPITILTNSQYFYKVQTILSELEYKSLLICYTHEQITTSNQNYLITSKIDIILKYLQNQVYYLNDEYLGSNRLFRISDIMTRIQNQRAFYLDFTIIEKEYKWQSTLKLLGFEEKQSCQQICYIQNYCKLWQLEYNPIEEFETFKIHLIRSLKQMSRLELIKLNIFELQKRFLSKIRYISHFSQLLQYVTSIYCNDFNLRAQINVVLGSIEHMYDYRKIQVIKPLIIILLNNYSGLFRINKPEKNFSMILKINKRSFQDIMIKNNFLLNTQFIQCHHRLQDKKIKMNENYIVIECQSQGVKNSDFYCNFITLNMSNRTQTYLVPPLSKFKILDSNQISRSEILRLKLLNKPSYLSKIIERNTIEISQYKMDLTDLFQQKNYGLHFISKQDKEQFNFRLKFYDFIKYFTQQKYYQAERKLLELKKITSQDNKNLVSRCSIELWLNTGKIYKATEEISMLDDENLIKLYKQRIYKIEIQLTQTQFQIRNIDNEKVFKWTVNFNKTSDIFIMTKDNSDYKSKFKSNDKKQQMLQDLLDASLQKSDNSWIEQFHNQIQGDDLYQQFFKTNNFGQQQPKTKVRIMRRGNKTVNISESKVEDKVLQNTQKCFNNKQNVINSTNATIQKKKKHYKIMKKCRKINLI